MIKSPYKNISLKFIILFELIYGILYSYLWVIQICCILETIIFNIYNILVIDYIELFFFF